jgi:hypothetical protein
MDLDDQKQNILQERESVQTFADALRFEENLSLRNKQKRLLFLFFFSSFLN